jgi:hypothetical protein
LPNKAKTFPNTTILTWKLSKKSPRAKGGENCPGACPRHRAGVS